MRARSVDVPARARQAAGRILRPERPTAGATLAGLTSQPKAFPWLWLASLAALEAATKLAAS